MLISKGIECKDGEDGVSINILSFRLNAKSVNPRLGARLVSCSRPYKFQAQRLALNIIMACYQSSALFHLNGTCIRLNQ